MTRRRLAAALLALLALPLIPAALLYQGILWFNDPSLERYPSPSSEELRALLR